MIFINTRPVDENAQCERRPSKAPSHSGHTHPQERSALFVRMALCSITFYVLVSAFPASLFYPVSLLSMVVPFLAFFFACCSCRKDFLSAQPILFIAIFGIFVKIAAIVVYICLFPNRDFSRKTGRTPQRTEAEFKHYRTVFYIILATVELFILIIGICLKWQLVTLQKRDQIQKRRSTLVSNRPLIDGEAGGPRRSLQA